MEDGQKKKQKIMIVDDSEINRSLLTEILKKEFDILEAGNGAQAISILQKFGTEIDLILLDIVMPDMDGFEVLAIMNKYHWIEDIPVIMISGEEAPSYMDRAYEQGVMDYIRLPFDALIVRRRVVNTMMLYAKQKKLIGMVADQIYEQQKSSSLMINILSHIVEFRNGESGLHVLHISTMTALLLERLIQKTSRYHLTYVDISLISTASSLHDIGKISLPENILNKPGKLTKQEFELMRAHPLIGASMLKRLPFHQNEPLVRVAYEICRWHHERYDGRGYPDGLKGEEIPVAAQVVALADVYDALTSERIYKKALPHETAIKMIVEGECGTFNPLLIECLLDISDRIQTELTVNAFNSRSRYDLCNIAQEMLHHEELSALKRNLQMLEYERTKYQFFVSVTQEIQFEFTSTPPMLTISEWGARRLGLREITVNPYRNKQFLSVINQDNLQSLALAVHSTDPGNPIVQKDCKITVDGNSRWHRVICRVMWEPGDPLKYAGVVGEALDIQEGYSQMTDLQYRASHDCLTGLYNHAYARKIIQDRLQASDDRQFVLTILDLDFFKSVNDQHGHMFGDRVLQYLAEKLCLSTGENDITARIGGDEFLVFLEDRTDMEQVIDRIFRALTGACNGFPISISMGIAQTAVVGKDYNLLLRCADQALYEGKRRGRKQCCFYDDSMKNIFSSDSDAERNFVRESNEDKKQGPFLKGSGLDV